MITKYDLDDTVSCNCYYGVATGIISMITITRKGIRYRMKLKRNSQRDMWDNQVDVWEDQIIGREDELND